jgi:hypothetical protein
VVAVSLVVDFSQSLGAVAVRLEVLRQSDRIGRGIAKVGAQVVDAERLRPQACEQCISRRRADRLIAVGPIEPHAACGQLINVRSVGEFIAIASQQRLQVVDANKQHVGPLSCTGQRGKCDSCE